MSVFDDLVVFSRDGALPNKAMAALAIAGSDWRVAELEISRAFTAIEQFHTERMPSYNKMYLAAENRNPALRGLLTARFEALDRPYYDATRLYELSTQVTDSGRGSTAGRSVTLAEYAEAMDSLVLTETRAADSFARFTSQR